MAAAKVAHARCAALRDGGSLLSCLQPCCSKRPRLKDFFLQLPWSTKWHELKDLFSEFNAKFADVKSGYDGRSRGYGIVRFDTEEDAAAALSLNGRELDSRAILVRYDRQGPGDQE